MDARQRHEEVEVVNAVLKLVREVMVEAGVAGAPSAAVLEGITSALVKRGLSLETARMTVRLALAQEAEARGVWA